MLNEGGRSYSKLFWVELILVVIPPTPHHLRSQHQVPVSPPELIWSPLCGLGSAFGALLLPGDEGSRRTPGRRRIEEVEDNKEQNRNNC